MGRTIRYRKPIRPKPPEKVELSDKHLKLRIAATIIFLLLGASALAYAITGFISGGSGLREIKPEGAAGATCAEDFVFVYDVGSVKSASFERRALTAIYSEAAQTAYELFTVDAEIEGVANMWYINRHPNEDITVDPTLYDALLKADSSRLIYLGPVYSTYDNLFYMQSPDGASDFDPQLNEVLKEYFAEICEFAQDDSQISLEFLGENSLRLNVSQEYLSFAEYNEIDTFIDFYWLKNAFIADYLAKRVTEQGFTHGSIVSYDGFYRSLGPEGKFSFNIYRRMGDMIYTAAVMDCLDSEAVVYLRDYAVTVLDTKHYLVLPNGETRSPYLSLEDGFNRVAAEELIAHSKSADCAEIALRIAPLYIAETLDESALIALEGDGIDAIVFSGSELRHTAEKPALSYLDERYSEKRIVR